MDIYRQPGRAGKNVVILGGGLVGVELGVFLSMNGSKVTILEMLPALSYGAAGVHGALLDLKIVEYGITVELGTKAVEITDKGVIGVPAGGTAGEGPDGQRRFFGADTVVYAVGLRPEWDLADALRGSAGEFYQVGDCLLPRNMLMANQEGYCAAKDIGRY